MTSASSTPSPREALQEEISDLQRQLNNLQDGVRLASLRDEVEDLDNTSKALDQRIRNLRSQGYAFEKELQPQCHNLRQRWIGLKPQILTQINQQSTQLSQSVRTAENLMIQVNSRANNPVTARPLVAQAKSAISTLESKVSAAQSSIRGMYDSFQKELDQQCKHLTEVEWTMTQLAEASFQLLPTECALMAVEGVWLKDGKEDGSDPKGVLFLTDQRLLFEQKQEVATKKILFITTEKQKVQQLVLEIPVALLQTVQGLKKGLFSHEDHLELIIAPGGPVQTAQFHIDGQDSQRWQGLLNQAKAHEFDKDRVIAIDQAAAEKARSAPTQCPTCGGAITQTVLRGMDSITCAYCGQVIRL